MEPLDPKAELMRLADAYAAFDQSTGIEMWRPIKARDALSAAISQVLADARRLALEELATELEALNGYVMKDALCTIIRNKARLAVDGKAGGT